MEIIHDIAKKPWISSNKLIIRNLAVQKSKLLQEHNLTLDGSEHKDEDFGNLEKELENFVVQDEKKVRPYFLFNSTDERVLTKEPKCRLKLYEKQLEHAQRMISDRSYKVNYLARLKTTRRETLMRHSVLTNRQDQSDDTTEVAIDDSTCGQKSSTAVLLVVQVWPQPKKTGKLKLEREAVFKSDQSLIDLRNQLECHRDFANPMDLSDNPEETDLTSTSRGEMFKSGFFLIENTFYNDLRDANNTNLSDPIIRWASDGVTIVDREDDRYVSKSRGIGPFVKARMEQSYFDDLIIRLGYPYLYMHQGNCEHLFCISDIKYVQRNKRFKRLKFPFVTAANCGREEDHLKCYMCKNGPPHWYTRGNSRLPVDPFFFCQGCFKAFNYDKSNKKIGQFNAYLWNWPGGSRDLSR